MEHYWIGASTFVEGSEATLVLTCACDSVAKTIYAVGEEPAEAECPRSKPE